MARYRVVDLRITQPEDAGFLVEADTPEQAAHSVLGLELTPSGRASDRRAIVHSQDPSGTFETVKLYVKARDRILDGL